ncbi:methylamine utilization protein MauE [mine drainage metagenome]|uniref:Methylamine utilization protein MauE n=1 Tax=mine drainage metagenome TaxID=410659 RepID=A0A1J5S3L6_9ZZZZ
MKARRWFDGGALVALGAVFGVAGALKLADPVAFADAIYRYRLLPWGASLALAVYLPWLELICAVALGIARLRRPAVAVLAGLCTVFLVALILARIRGLSLSCGCLGGESSGSDLGTAIVRDAVLLALAAVYLTSRGRRKANQGR